MENIVYTTQSCPFCIMVKRILADHGVEFEERLLTDRADLEEVKKKYKWRTVPLVILNGQFIGGCEDTQALIRAGKLDQVLKA